MALVAAKPLIAVWEKLLCFRVAWDDLKRFRLNEATKPLPSEHLPTSLQLMGQAIKTCAPAKAASLSLAAKSMGHRSIGSRLCQ